MIYEARILAGYVLLESPHEADSQGLLMWAILLLPSKLFLTFEKLK